MEQDCRITPKRIFRTPGQCLPGNPGNHQPDPRDIGSYRPKRLSLIIDLPVADFSWADKHSSLIRVKDSEKEINALIDDSIAV